MRHSIIALVLLAGCYRYAFDQRPPAPGETLTTHSQRKSTYILGLVGTGVEDTSKYCKNPVRTETRVDATDALLSVVTLWIYTPHTLYITCGNPPPAAASAEPPAAPKCAGPQCTGQ